MIAIQAVWQFAIVFLAAIKNTLSTSNSETSKQYTNISKFMQIYTGHLNIDS